MKFNEKLKILRERAGLTQPGLAQSAGLPLGSLRGYEQGQREPLWKVVFRLARALGVSCEEFADCEGVFSEAPQTIDDWPLSKLILELDAAETAFGPKSSTARTFAHALERRLRAGKQIEASGANSQKVGNDGLGRRIEASASGGKGHE